MTEAPTPADTKQLEELGLEVAHRRKIESSLQDESG